MTTEHSNSAVAGGAVLIALYRMPAPVPASAHGVAGVGAPERP
jgi:hypothetical protein